MGLWRGGHAYPHLSLALLTESLYDSAISCRKPVETHARPVYEPCPAPLPVHSPPAPGSQINVIWRASEMGDLLSVSSEGSLALLRGTLSLRWHYFHFSLSLRSHNHRFGLVSPGPGKYINPLLCPLLPLFFMTWCLTET